MTEHDKEGYHRENRILKIKKAQNAYTFIFWFTLSGWSLVLFFKGLTRQFCVYGLFLFLLGDNDSFLIKSHIQKFNTSETVEMVIIALLMILMTLSFYLCAILKAYL